MSLGNSKKWEDLFFFTPSSRVSYIKIYYAFIPGRGASIAVEFADSRSGKESNLYLVWSTGLLHILMSTPFWPKFIMWIYNKLIFPPSFILIEIVLF